METYEFEYGDKVKDKFHGIAGFITAKISFFGRSPDKYRIDYIDEDGILEEIWIDCDRLEPTI